MYDLIKFEDGKCDFYSNGFDCRDCALKYECEFSEVSIYENETETKNNTNNGADAPQNF